jgi:hypothetical protein
MSKQNLQEGIRNFWFGPLPIGKILTDRTRWSNDESTSEAREQLNSTLEHSGAVILDAHQSGMDIVAVAALLTQLKDLEAVVAPVAGYLYYMPHLQKPFFEKLNAQLPVQAMPVFRSEEQGKSKRKVTNRSGLSQDEMNAANDRYVKASLSAVMTPHELSIIAPYGTTRRENQKLIRGGVAEVLQSGCPAFCTLAMFDWKTLKYVVGLSHQMPQYGYGSDRTEMTADIAKTFSDLQDQIR